MLIVYLLIGFGMFTVLETLNQIQQFDLIDASLVSYKNVTGPLPSRQTATLTSSFQKRISELYNEPLDSHSGKIDAHQISEDEKNGDEFTKRCLIENVHTLSKIYTSKKEASHTRLISINTAWNFYNPRTIISLFSLNDGYSHQNNAQVIQRQQWRNCFSHSINGSLESIMYNDEGDLVLGSFYVPAKKERFIRLYDKIGCEYITLMNSTQFFSSFCNEENHFNKYTLCHDLNLTNTNSEPFLPNEIPYQDISINNQFRVQNIATNGELIAYTTLDNPLEIFYMYKDFISDDWVKKSIQYPKSFKKNRIYQNLGLVFIGDSSKHEKQLLVVDLIGNNNELHIIYFIYRFIPGHLLLSSEYKNFIETNSTISWEKLLGHYMLNETDAIVHKIYASGMYDLFKIDISGELNGLDALNTQKLPNSIIKYNPETKQVLVASLQRYLLLICMKENEVFAAYQLKEFEDHNYKIKNFDMFFNGLYFTFLVHSKNKMEVFLLNNEYLKDIAINKLYLVNFDYSLKGQEKSIIDIKLIKSIENEMKLFVALTSGEIATYSLHLGASRFNRTLLDIIDEELDFFSFALLLIAVVAFLTLKFARSIRININIRHNR